MSGSILDIGFDTIFGPSGTISFPLVGLYQKKFHGIVSHFFKPTKSPRMFEAAGSSAFGGFEYRKGAGDDHITKFI
jgi:hypothetical protein